MIAPRLLIVEDEIVVADNLAARLRHLGYGIAGVAFQAAEAIKLASDTKPDLVLMDIGLPGEVDGVAAADAIRHLLDVPVVYLTGYADDATLERAKLTEPFGYILKPFGLDDLRTTIEMALYKHGMEKKLRESEGKYRTLVEQSLQAILIVQGVPTRIVFANSQCEDLSGYSVDELLSFSPDQVASVIHPDDRAFILGRIAQRIAGGRFAERDETRLIHRDGSTRWVEYFAGLTDHESQPALQIALIDITARKEAEAALRTLNIELERRVQERTIELAETNALLEREIWEHWRTEEALQQRNEELVALNAVATIASQSRDLESLLSDALKAVLDAVGVDQGWIQLLDERSGGGRLILAPYRGLAPATVTALQAARPGEGVCWAAVRSGAPVLFEGLGQEPAARIPGLCVPLKSKERVLGVLGILSSHARNRSRRATDLLMAIGHQIGVAIDNLRLAREVAEIDMLRELDRLRSELIANVSHELRTPLGLIEIQATSLLMDDVAFDHETQQEFLRGIRDETRRLEAIVDNLLNLSRIEGGRIRLDRRPTDLAELAAAVLTGMHAQLARHCVVYDFAGPLVCHADAGQIERVLMNLLSNAVKYSSEGTLIAVRGRLEGAQALLQVQDQGIGIPIEEQDKIFERFYRVENELTQKVGGVGLGLAVCRGIVDVHGGRIWVESEPGIGSTFCVALPLAPVDDATAGCGGMG